MGQCVLRTGNQVSISCAGCAVGGPTCCTVWKNISEVISGLIARVTVISDACPREGDSNRPWKSEPSLNRIIGDWATRNETVFALHQPPVEFLSHFPLAFYTTKQRNVFPPIFLSPS